MNETKPLNHLASRKGVIVVAALTAASQVQLPSKFELYDTICYCAHLALVALIGVTGLIYQARQDKSTVQPDNGLIEPTDTPTDSQG